MKPKQINVDLATVDVDGIFENQTTAGAGSITLDGTEVTNGKWTSPDGFPHQIAIDAAGDISGVTFTVTGYADINENIQITEDITGVTTTAVESTNYFYSITSITVDGAVGSNAFAGIVDEATSQIYPINWRADNISLLASVTGTVDYTIQQTFDDIENETFPYTWEDIDDTNLVGATTTQTASITTIPRAIRLKINSYSTGAAVELGIITADI